MKNATSRFRRFTMFKLAVVTLALAACDKATDVGAACEIAAPCVNGACGFVATETYLDKSASSCESACIVRRLDNGTNGSIPANPEVVCDANGEPSGCVTPAQLKQASYCTCPCDGPKSRDHYCECPDSFACAGVVEGEDSYCVRRP